MQRDWIMITLTVRHGKESEIEAELNRFIQMNNLHDVVVVGGRARTKHFHLLGKKDAFNGCRLDKWPGIAKEHIITESQAIFIKQNHDQKVCVQTEGKKMGLNEKEKDTKRLLRRILNADFDGKEFGVVIAYENNAKSHNTMHAPESGVGGVK